VLRKLFFILLYIGIIYNAVGHTLAIVKDIHDINYVSLLKIAKYNLYHAEYGTVIVKSFGRPGAPGIALTGHLTDANVHELDPINKIIFMGHGRTGAYEGITVVPIRDEIIRLMGILNGAGKLTVDDLRILSCNSATRPIDGVSTTDAIINGLAAANIPGLVVTIQGNAGTSITDVFTGGIDDTIRIVIEDHAAEVGEIQRELEDHQPCLELMEDCPGEIRDIFDTIPAGAKVIFARYAYYLQKQHEDLPLTPMQRACLAYYNQGVRTFYHALIANSDAGGYLLPDGVDLFNTVFNSTYYSGLPPEEQEGYLTLVKNGNPPAIDVAPPPPVPPE
jgi:hypothetical protein